MVESKMNNTSSICFSEEPKKMKQYLKELGYKFNVKREKGYLQDKFTMTIDISPMDRFVFAFLRAHYTQVPQ